MEKLPNWLRYILAIPFGIVCSIIGYYFVWFSNVLFASPDSLYMVLIDYMYTNCFNVFVMIYSMNYMLPKHQFKFTVTLSIIYCSLCLFALGLVFTEMSYTWSDYLAFILTFGAFIYSCYYTFNEYPTTTKQEKTTSDVIIQTNNSTKITYCNECGTKLEENSSFCYNCGNKIKE